METLKKLGGKKVNIKNLEKLGRNLKKYSKYVKILKRCWTNFKDILKKFGRNR